METEAQDMQLDASFEKGESATKKPELSFYHVFLLGRSDEYL
jgi:hypothetical protein